MYSPKRRYVDSELIRNYMLKQIQPYYTRIVFRNKMYMMGFNYIIWRVK